MKRPPKPRPVRPSGALPSVGGKAASERSWSIGKRILAALGAVGTVLTLGLTVMHYWPELSVEPTAEADISNALRDISRLRTSRAIRLTMSASRQACDVRRLAGATTRHHWTSVFHRCDLRTIVGRSTLSPLMRHTRLALAIAFSSRPEGFSTRRCRYSFRFSRRIIPLHQEQEFRFETRRMSDGKIQWLHIPVDEEQSKGPGTMHVDLVVGRCVGGDCSGRFLGDLSDRVGAVGRHVWVGGFDRRLSGCSGSEKERIDLVETLRKQWLWNNTRRDSDRSCCCADGNRAAIFSSSRFSLGFTPK